jgi:hypothetical protein
MQVLLRQVLRGLMLGTVSTQVKHGSSCRRANWLHAEVEESHLHQHRNHAEAECTTYHKQLNSNIPRFKRACIVWEGSANEGTCRSPCAHVPQALLLLSKTQLHVC